MWPEVRHLTTSHNTSSHWIQRCPHTHIFWLSGTVDSNGFWPAMNFDLVGRPASGSAERVLWSGLSLQPRRRGSRRAAAPSPRAPSNAPLFSLPWLRLERMRDAVNSQGSGPNRPRPLRTPILAEMTDLLMTKDQVDTEHPPPILPSTLSKPHTRLSPFFCTKDQYLYQALK